MRIEEYTDQELLDELARRMQLRNIEAGLTGENKECESCTCDWCEHWTNKGCDREYCKYLF